MDLDDENILECDKSMYFRTGGARIAHRAAREVELSLVDLPAFLCPGLVRICRSQPLSFQRRKLHSSPEQTISHSSSLFLSSSGTIRPPRILASNGRLPPQCAGCGALSQTVDADEPGFFNLKRRSVKEYLAGKPDEGQSSEDAILEKALKKAAETNPKLLDQLGFGTPGSTTSKQIFQ